jgi:hypothetical protein
MDRGWGTAELHTLMQDFAQASLAVSAWELHLLLSKSTREACSGPVRHHGGATATGSGGLRRRNPLDPGHPARPQISACHRAQTFDAHTAEYTKKLAEATAAAPTTADPGTGQEASHGAKFTAFRAVTFDGYGQTGRLRGRILEALRPTLVPPRGGSWLANLWNSAMHTEIVT